MGVCCGLRLRRGLRRIKLLNGWDPRLGRLLEGAGGVGWEEEGIDRWDGMVLRYDECRKVWVLELGYGMESSSVLTMSCLVLLSE